VYNCLWCEYVEAVDVITYYQGIQERIIKGIKEAGGFFSKDTAIRKRYKALLKALERNDGGLLQRIDPSHYKGIGKFVSSLYDTVLLDVYWGKALSDIIKEQQSLGKEAVKSAFDE